jgi:DNA polymerase alpha subunit A
VTAKRKREEDKEKQDKINNGISKYFSGKTAAKAPKPKVGILRRRWRFT